MPPPLLPVFADMMLGRLATWLRLIGADVAYGNAIDDDELLRRAETEHRLVLTRDHALARRLAPEARFVIAHDRLADQLRQVAAAFDLTGLRPFSRCVRCNVLIEEVDKEMVRERLWPYVYGTQERILRCPSCGRLYWGATHPVRARRDLARMLGEDFVARLFEKNAG